MARLWPRGWREAACTARRAPAAVSLRAAAQRHGPKAARSMCLAPPSVLQWAEGAAQLHSRNGWKGEGRAALPPVALCSREGVLEHTSIRQKTLKSPTKAQRHRTPIIRPSINAPPGSSGQARLKPEWEWPTQQLLSAGLATGHCGRRDRPARRVAAGAAVARQPLLAHRCTRGQRKPLQPVTKRTLCIPATC